MNFIFPIGNTPQDRIQSRLLLLAALFLILNSLILTLAQVVRLHSWQVDYRGSHWVGTAIWLVGFSLLHKLTLQRLPGRDPYLLPITALLSGWGLLTIWRLDNEFGWRQAAWLGLCQIVFGLIVFKPQILVLLRRYKYIWLTGGLLLTGLTFFFGTYPGGNGPHLWLGCCGVYLQPSEPLKLLLVIYLAAYLADRSLLSPGLVSLLMPTLILIGAALIILVAQRDLGTASLFIVLYFVMAFLASGKRRLLVVSGLLLILAVGVGYRLFDVIQVRMAAWLTPWLDPSGRSYQIVQSLLAVASGGTFGNGLGIGNPSVVPVAHSDFIFAAIAEETGLVGSMGLIILLGILAIRGLITALHATSAYQRFLAAGITVNLIAQSLLIIGGNLRLLPLTGVTLPLVSYGGSSLLTSFISLALLLVISNHVAEDHAPAIQAKPFFITGSFLLVGLLAVGTVNIYWGFIRSDELQERGDNPRWAVTDLYVPRGRLLDRNNQPIVITTGKPGEYQRTLLQPALGPVVGYSHPLYGQAGLEASLDPYLRGLEGNPTSTIAFYHLLHGQTPPGLDVRLSLDQRIQQRADSLLEGRSGALVLINSQTGEILAMSSQPGFDPNRLDSDWKKWVNDPRGVFLNRATQGQYSPGTILGPFLLSALLNQENLPANTPAQSSLVFDGVPWECATPTSAQPTWGELISHGCPGAVNALAQRLRSDQILQLLHQIELDRAPQISLAVARVSSTPMQDEPARLAIGQGKMYVSPLQMALAAAALNPQGGIPTPRIAMAVNTPVQGWVVLPTDPAPLVAELRNRSNVTRLLQLQDLPAWQVTATAQSLNGKISWYIAGTTAEWKGPPLTLALVLEENDPASAQKIGVEILRMIMNP